MFGHWHSRVFEPANLSAFCCSNSDNSGGNGDTGVRARVDTSRRYSAAGSKSRIDMMGNCGNECRESAKNTNEWIFNRKRVRTLLSGKKNPRGGLQL